VTRAEREAGDIAKATAEDSDTGGVRHPLRSRRFIAYWLAGIVSNVGTWLQSVTAGVVIFQLTGSALMVGVLGFANFAPVFLLALPGGYLADRYGPRVVIIVAHAFAFVIGAVLTALAFTGRANAAVLIGTAALLGICYAIAKPALSSMVPELVPREILPKATAFNTLQFTAGQIGGSLLSAAILVSAGAPWAFATNCLSFLGPIAAMIVIGPIGTSAKARRKALDESDTGALRLARQTPPMITVLVTVALANAAVEGLRTLSPAFVTEALHIDVSRSGLLIASYSVGGLIGLTGFGPVHARIRGFMMLLCAFGMTAVGAIALGTTSSVPVAVLGAAVIGIGFSFTIPILNSTLLLLSPDAYRGRVMSMFAMAHLGFRPVWSLAAGAAASALGPRWALGILAIVSCAALGGVLRLRGVTEHPPNGTAQQAG
jgi:MFS family permease